MIYIIKDFEKYCNKFEYFAIKYRYVNTKNDNNRYNQTKFNYDYEYDN